VVVDKAAGETSHQVVARARRLLGTRKIGHAGTLDPMATGVLVLGVGRATRLLGYLSLTDKAYEATIRLGQATITDDADGEVTRAVGAVGITDGAIEQAMARLRGRIEQVPSAVSAIKVGGVRSYARVRSGTEVALAARPVTVIGFDVVSRRDLSAGGLAVVDLDVVVECSSGTYVRALARDLGAALGAGGHLTALRRTRVGPFTLAEAQSLEGPFPNAQGPDAQGPQIVGLHAQGPESPEPDARGPGAGGLGGRGPEAPEPDARRLMVTDLTTVARRCFPTLILTPDQARAVGYGRRLPGLVLPGGLTAMLDPTGTFLALYRPDGPDAVPEAVFVG
jgi:tRNA pseudouridine55 synthase